MAEPTASVSKVTAQLQLAELYQATNQPVDAKRIYEQIKKDNPSGEAAQLATQKFSELKWFPNVRLRDSKRWAGYSLPRLCSSGRRLRICCLCPFGRRSPDSPFLHCYRG